MPPTKGAAFIGKYRLDAKTGQKLNNNQHIFRHYNYQTQATTYFYRTNRKLVGKVSHPEIIKKHYRLGTRSLNPLPLLDLAHKSEKEEAFLLSPPPQIHTQDFQQLLLTNLLLLCKTAKAIHIPLEKKHIPKELNKCDSNVYNHFQAKPILHFTFPPENVLKVKEFLSKLDTYAEEYGMEESQD